MQKIMSTRATMSGFTMLEVLISIVVIAFGLLGVAGLQAFAVKNNQSAGARVVATALAMDMVDRLHSNWKGANEGAYNAPNVTSYATGVPSCNTSTGCNQLQLAQNDLNEWQAQVAAALPKGVGIVCLTDTPHIGDDPNANGCNGAGINTYAVKIWWSDDRSLTGNPAKPYRFSWPFTP
jgi:type IV pilus assembly protein PilV